jgi:hypothetical protein
MASSTEDIAFPNLPIVLSSLSLPCIILLTTVVVSVLTSSLTIHSDPFSCSHTGFAEASTESTFIRSAVFLGQKPLLSHVYRI